MSKNDTKNSTSFLKKAFKRNEIFFGLSFIVIFFLTLSIMSYLGLIPKEFTSSAKDNPTIFEKLQENSLEKLGLANGTSSNNQNQESISKNIIAENPIRITAPSISLNSVIENPASADYRTLDNSLTRGTVHYPGSGTVESGNMFIFGHSTGFRVVNNQAYKVFNNIHTMKAGDEVNIYTSSKIYTYKVTSVKLVNGDQALVDFSNQNRVLTLSTCNSFGQKSDRYVVEARFDHSIDI